MKMMFVPSDVVVVKIIDKLFWFDYKGVTEIQYEGIDIIGVDVI